MTEGLAAFAMLRFLVFPGLEAQPIAATPQALRASSPSRGAFKSSTRKGMATHTQLKLRFAAHLAGEPFGGTIFWGDESKASLVRGGGTAKP